MGSTKLGARFEADMPSVLPCCLPQLDRLIEKMKTRWGVRPGDRINAWEENCGINRVFRSMVIGKSMKLPRVHSPCFFALAVAG